MLCATSDGRRGVCGRQLSRRGRRYVEPLHFTRARRVGFIRDVGGGGKGKSVSRNEPWKSRRGSDEAER